jgi:hypothetical protein
VAVLSFNTKVPVASGAESVLVVPVVIFEPLNAIFLVLSALSEIVKPSSCKSIVPIVVPNWTSSEALTFKISLLALLAAFLARKYSLLSKRILAPVIASAEIAAVASTSPFPDTPV